LKKRFKRQQRFIPRGDFLANAHRELQHRQQKLLCSIVQSKDFAIPFGDVDALVVQAPALKFKNENGRKAIVACMGLAFKPDIDDLLHCL
jgi:hypothetical protein